MSSYPLVKYVDSPAAAAVVRYDFNDQNPNLVTSPAKKVTSFDPGVPTLEGDPDAVGQSWGFRSPSIVHTIKGTKAQAMAALSLLSREQLRRSNWLLFQPSAGTQPVWFKTYRTGYQPISLDQVWVRVTGGNDVLLKDTWKITVPVVADAFTYGARVTLGPYTVAQAPSGTNPMKIVLPAIKGDAPTNLRVSILPAAANAGGLGNTWLLGSWSADASQTDPIFDIGTGDGYTATGGTGAATVDATYFGGSYRTFSVAAATPNLLSRLTGGWAGIPFGRYKVMLRYETDSPAVTLQALFQLFLTNLGVPLGPAATVTLNGGNGTQQGWVDLGELTVPVSARVSLDSGFSASNSLLWALNIGTASGVVLTGKIDSFKLIPVAGPNVLMARNLKILCHPIFPLNSTNTGYFDGDDEYAWGVSGGNVNNWQNFSSLAGSYPQVDPAAAQNVLTVTATAKGQGVTGTVTTTLNAQSTVTPSYLPRFLHVGDGT